MAFKKREFDKKRDSGKQPKRGVYLLPNTITLCGMFSGFFAIIAALNGNYLHAAWAIILANIFDGLDGWIARLTNTSTRFGIELDSLSDLVAFGVAPSLLLYKWALMPFGRLGWAAAFLFVACGALRLARFNIQTGAPGSKAFKGMPIPGAATVLASVVIFYYEFWTGVPGKNFFFPAITILLSLLMVSTLRYHGLKEIDFREKKPFWVLIVFVLILFFLLIHPSTAIFVFAMTYLTWGIIENIFLFVRRMRLKHTEQNATEKTVRGPQEKNLSEEGADKDENH
ncbi:MAG: CDP-diacylglycerol--serine O-phosphatidyltransferase [Alphaproteobacteria bacterium]|uniref:CDP-diacylglycerol--serine O-phosphatidyltransferase n=1 Tax=Candidatus Nitrobium versatile TaxID=2884831 RepID=A0A953M2G3_9BACT|nr:CDP-diacylglycerol--serine O-phosphatidyltransferase [Candidatus Nitrobium versatile]